MPLSGPSSYLPTIDEFLAHWANVDTTLGSAFALNSGYNRATLVLDRAALVTKITAANNAAANVRGASELRDLKRSVVAEKMRQFNQTVRGQVVNKMYVGLCPRIPSGGSAVGKWQVALDQMSNCWNRINTDSPPPAGFTPPLVLNGSYALLNYTGDKTALLNAFTGYITNFENFQAAVADRDAHMANIRLRLVQYRAAVQGQFVSTHPLLDTLPQVYPPSGSTPRAVSLTGVWDAGSEEAVLTWTPTDDARVTEYQVRACFNSAYSTAEEEVLDTIPLGTETYSTAEGLAASSSFVTFKVYTLTATGNEKGSRSVKVTRP